MSERDEEDAWRIMDNEARPIINGHKCPDCGADLREGSHYSICKHSEV